ncbi:MAG: NYN domain-containing protein [Anaerolineaceae bacterium]|nr:NYN domain-containing protein [Anaerolineaceae bacterium]
MLGIPTSQRVALLIDADNIQLTQISHILRFSSYFGGQIIQRAYGDWLQPPLLSHKEHLDTLKIKRIQVDRVGKDSTDKQLMIEAGELLGGGTANLFVIVSGDGDFTQLCERIQKKKRTVVGIGHKAISSPYLQDACDSFYYVEELPGFIAQLKLESLLQEAYLQVKQPDGRAHLGQLGQVLRKLDPKYEHHFGKKLSKWIDNNPHIFKRHNNYVSRL